MISEKTIKLAAKMYECRDTARFLFSENYKDHIKAWGNVINAKAAKEKSDPLKAAVELAKETESPYSQIIIVAAAVELLEPSD